MSKYVTDKHAVKTIMELLQKSITESKTTTEVICLKLLAQNIDDKLGVKLPD